ncbi:MAG: ABC transporter permease subunit, partial [Deltaproteobacteria bacterium]|nr:ABC transporter permease subunit [Deltaproteobacteria bacterium]
MGSYILKRLAGAFFVLLTIVTLCFFMIRIAPGGPFDEEKAIPPDILRNIEKKYHMDEPMVQQYWRYVSGVFFHFDLGPSYKYPSRSVNEFIVAGLPVTLQLGFNALCVAIFIGVGTGLIAALRQNSRWDYTAMAMAMIGVSIPSFVMAPLMQLFFGLYLGWFPVAGWDRFSHMVLPSVALGFLYAAYVARLTRGGMLEVTRQDYVRTA